MWKVLEQLEALDLRLPGLDAQGREGLRTGREQLMKE